MKPVFLGFRASLVTILAGAVLSVRSQEKSELGFIEENDLVVRTDRHYTQGLKLWYFGEDQTLSFGSTELLQRIPKFGYADDAPMRQKYGLEIGQSIFTPANTKNPVPDPADRPYAGWLYLGTMIQRNGLTPRGTPLQENLQVEFGVIGPWALAGEAQTWIHELRGFSTPQGWSHQLKNEPGIQIRYRRSVRYDLIQASPFGIDIVPYAGGILGHPETSLRVGGLVRLGLNLSETFGPSTIDSLAITSNGRRPDPASSWSLFGFGGFEGSFVAHNAFLDGNLFYSGPSVPKEFFVGDFKSGLGIEYRAVEIGFTYVFRTREFGEQGENHRFGSVYLRWRF